MSVIANISTALPTNKYKQSHLAGFMSELFELPEDEKRKLNILYAKSGIETRYSVIPDFSLSLKDRTFFPNTETNDPFPLVEKRMDYFQRFALPLCAEAIEKCLDNSIAKDQVTHLITVSCTGLSAPGLDIDLVQHLKLDENINRTSVNFMGCYAAVHALKQADYICKSDPQAIVLIVCVELCTIHFQKIDNIDNHTANLLFADGAAAALIVPDGFKGLKEGLRIREFHSHISLKARKDMAWGLTSTGFLMTLSSYVPQLIESEIGIFFEKAIQKLKIEKREVKHWAIHPGGRKILEVIEKELQLDKKDLESSYTVLKNYGNMSSPTILFVLKDLWETKIGKDKKELTFAVAFGPGLTMESVILENV